MFLLIAVGCSDPGGPEWDGVVVRDSSGTRIVDNSAPDRPAEQLAVHLADLQTPDGALTALPWTIDVSRDGRHILVGDATGARISVFGPDGRHLRDMGRQGGGPGELGAVSAIDIDPDGDLRVLDARRGLVHRWSSGFELMGADPAPTAYWGPGFSVAGDVLTMVRSETRGQELVQRLTRITPTKEDVLLDVSIELQMMELPCVSQPAPPVLAPDLVWTEGGGRIGYAVGSGYRVDLAVGDPTAGDVAGTSVRRQLPPIVVNREMAVSAARTGPGPWRQFMRMCEVTADAIVDAVGHVERVSPIRTLVLGADGQLLVGRLDPSGGHLRPGAVDRFDREGRYLGTLDLGAVPVALLSDSVLVGLRLTDAGEPVAGLYALRHAATAGTSR